MSANGEAPWARMRRTRWPGWIWLLPLGVMGFLVWLMLRTWVFSATVLVVFPSSSGITSGASVKFRDVEVGTVEDVSFNSDMTRVVLRLAMQPEVDDLLREQTHFWIAEPSLAAGQLRNLVSGAYVAMDPGPGEPTRRFEGLENPPQVARWDEGRHYTLTTRDPGSLSVGTPVRYLQTPVGEVRGVSLADDADAVHVSIFIHDEFSHLVREGSSFWKPGRISLGDGGAGPGLELPSIRGMISGAVDFHTPEVLSGAPAEAGHAFALHESREAALSTPEGPRFPYLVRFPDPVGGLGAGSPVELQGVVVGRVNSTRLTYDTETGGLATLALIAIDPLRLGLEVTAETSREEASAELNQALDRLVGEGLRARPSGGLIPGSRAVALTRMPEAGEAALRLDREPPELPAVPGGGGIDQAVDSVSRFAGKLEQLPLEQIASDLRSSAQQVNELLNDPAIESSMEHLNAALADIESIAAEADRHAEPLLESLEQAAEGAESVARRADQFIGGPMRQNRDLAELVHELTDAAEAVGELASFLSRHPEALVTGRD